MMNDMIARILAVVAIVFGVLVWFMYSTTSAALALTGTTGTINTHRGVITTVANPNIATGGEYVITISNNKVKANSVILLTTQFGTAGQASVAYLQSVTAGTFVVRVRNVGSGTIATPVNVHFHTF